LSGFTESLKRAEDEAVRILEALNATRDLEYFNVTAADLDTQEERLVEAAALHSLASAWVEDTEKSKSRGGAKGASDGGATPGDVSGGAALIPKLATLPHNLSDLDVILSLTVSASPAPNPVTLSHVGGVNLSAGGGLAPANPGIVSGKAGISSTTTTGAGDISSLGSIFSRRDISGSMTLGAGSGTGATANVFKTLTRKLKDLEIDSTVTQSYISDMHTLYSSALSTLAQEVAALKGGLKNISLQQNSQQPSLGMVANHFNATVADVELWEEEGEGGHSEMGGKGKKTARVPLDDGNDNSTSMLDKRPPATGGGCSRKSCVFDTRQGVGNCNGLMMINGTILEEEEWCGTVFSNNGEIESILLRLGEDIGNLTHSIHRMDIRQTAVALAIVRMLQEGGTAATLSPTGSIVRLEDALPFPSSTPTSSGLNNSQEEAIGGKLDANQPSIHVSNGEVEFKRDGGWVLSLSFFRRFLLRMGLSVMDMVEQTTPSLKKGREAPPFHNSSPASSSSDQIVSGVAAAALSASIESLQLQVASLQASLLLALIASALGLTFTIFLCFFLCLCFCLRATIGPSARKTTAKDSNAQSVDDINIVPTAANHLPSSPKLSTHPLSSTPDLIHPTLPELCSPRESIVDSERQKGEEKLDPPNPCID